MRENLSRQKCHIRLDAGKFSCVKISTFTVIRQTILKYGYISNILLQGDNIEAYNPIYKGYGKKLIRRFKLHPDTYVQLALQLAYYRMHRK